MNDAREKIKHVLYKEIQGQCDNPQGILTAHEIDGARLNVDGELHLCGISRAILSELPSIVRGMIKPLEFTEYGSTGDMIDGYEVGERSIESEQNYFVDQRASDFLYVVRMKVFGDVVFESKSKLRCKMWANTHHKSTILKQMGLDT